MTIVNRAKAICLRPKEEWNVIAGETVSAKNLLKDYAFPLAAIAVVANFIGLLVGRSAPIATGLVGSVLLLALMLGAVYATSLIIDALAPTFGGQKNAAQALKVAVYSATPGWIAGVLAIVPALAVLGWLGLFYSAYLLYLGLHRLMKSPPEKTVGYAAAVAACWIGMMIVSTVIVASVAAAGVIATGTLPSAH